MSGICGVIRWDGRPVSRTVLERMAASAPHRGFDGVSLWTDGVAGLAHQALHVTVEDAADRLPAVADSVAVTADARIDNRDALAHQLTDELRGRPPTTSALLLAGYRKWGAGLPDKLLGDFAFVLWDSARRRVLAARDPMGLRTLYYRIEPSRVLFGTEIKQILAAPDISARVSERAVLAYLVGGAGPPPTWSFYEGVRMLPAGHVFERTSAGDSTVRRFWCPDGARDVRYPTDEQYAQRFRELLSEAVRCRIRTPRPAGVFLSGGVDSGAVAAIAGQLLQQQPELAPEVRAYSFAFDELVQCDERHISRGIVDAYDLPFTDVPADDAWPLQEGIDHVPDRDAPTGLWFFGLWNRGLALARSLGTVVLMGGDRGDLVAGESVYDHSGLFWRGRWRTLLRELRMLSEWQQEPLTRVARRSLWSPLSRALWPTSPPRRWLRRIRGRAHAAMGGGVPSWVRRGLLQSHGGPGELQEAEGLPPLRGDARRQRYASIFVASQMATFVESERTYARHGTCFADPFSDRRITEFVLSIPQRIVNRPDDRKRLIKRAMRGVVPTATAAAQKKTTPWPLAERGLREREVSRVRALFQGSRAAEHGWIDDDEVRSTYEAYLRGASLPSGFWAVLSLEVWLRRFWT